jgi:hypothetical protein
LSKAYPLQWPKGWPVTEPYKRGPAAFKVTLPSALANLEKQVRLMGGSNLVLSSNYTLGSSNPTEPGVVAYFSWNKLDMAIPCDRWQRIEANVQAIALTVEAMRGMERWGAKHMITAMFSGFKALPASTGGINPRAVLGLDDNNAPLTESEITEAYKRKAKTEHPDMPGGSAEKWARLREAHDLLMQNFRK